MSLKTKAGEQRKLHDDAAQQTINLKHCGAMGVRVRGHTNIKVKYPLHLYRLLLNTQSKSNTLACEQHVHARSGRSKHTYMYMYITLLS